MIGRGVAVIAVLVGCAPCWGQEVLPTWTVDKSGSSIVWNDAKLAILAFSDKLEALDLVRGATLWTVPYGKKPDQIGASADFVCVRNGGKLQGYNARTGAPNFALDDIGAMAVLEGKLYCTNGKNEIRQFAPPETQSAVVKLDMPYQPFVDPKRGVHLGKRVLWRSSPEFLGCYDFQRFALAWKSAYGFYRYTKAKTQGATDSGKVTYEDVTIWDELFAYYPYDDFVAIHLSHVMVHGSKDSKEVKAEYLWTLDVEKGGAGSKQSLQRVDTDKPGVPLIHWTAGVPKPWLVARYEHVSQPGQHRFDVYPGGGSLDLRTGYLPFDRVASGAKGQLVAWRVAAAGQPASFDVLGATNATKALWKANGRVLPRMDDKEPYLVLAVDDQAKTSRLVRLDSSGAEVAMVDLGAGDWEPVTGTAHLLLRGPSGRLVRVDRATLAITHRYDFVSGVTQAIALGTDEVLIRAGGKLARVSFKAAAPAK